MPPNDLLRIIDHIPLLSRPSCRARFNNVTTREQILARPVYFTTVTVYYPSARRSLPTPIIPTPPHARESTNEINALTEFSMDSKAILRLNVLYAIIAYACESCKSNIIIVIAIDGSRSSSLKDCLFQDEKIIYDFHSRIFSTLPRIRLLIESRK